MCAYLVTDYTPLLSFYPSLDLWHPEKGQINEGLTEVLTPWVFQSLRLILIDVYGSNGERALEQKKVISVAYINLRNGSFKIFNHGKLLKSNILIIITLICNLSIMHLTLLTDIISPSHKSEWSARN